VVDGRAAVSTATFDSRCSAEFRNLVEWQAEGRVRVVKVSTEIVFDIIKNGVVRPFEVVDGLPADTMLIKADYDHNYGTHPYFTLYVASGEFEPAPKGSSTPEVMVTFRRTD
jgi:hypothetical protein